MIFSSVRDFKTKAAAYLSSGEDVVVTKRGKPIALVTPIPERSPEALMLEMRALLKEAHISKKEALAALDAVRKEIYGSRRR